MPLNSQTACNEMQPMLPLFVIKRQGFFEGARIYLGFVVDKFENLDLRSSFKKF